MSKARDVLVRELLERLEAEETKLLSWGVVDGGFSAAEVADAAQGVLEASASELTADDLWQELFDRPLLFSFREAGHEFLRTRMAAEGLDSWGRPQPGGVVLASLRSTGQPENILRLPSGQSWQLCEDIGHPFGLAQPLRISRTSSQDVGVEQGSDVIVATAALEVGYNDPDVGGVMQHKAPRDWAAFLQRNGRAGQPRVMRPWTAVVLSDYGRDRLAYQAYDQLFDPQLPLRSLPVGNRYVLRMQAAFALMDWVARELPPDMPTGSVWADFSGPAEGTG